MQGSVGLVKGGQYTSGHGSSFCVSTWLCIPREPPNLLEVGAGLVKGRH